jgi:hypothetical protein
MGIAILLTMVGVILYSQGILGISQERVIENVKQDLEQNGANPDEFQYMTSSNDCLYAVLAYREDRTDNRYYIYANRPGFNFGWQFRASGNVVPGMGLMQLAYDDLGSVYLALNEDGQIDTVEYLGDNPRTRSVGGYPVVETAKHGVAFYDKDGNSLAQ